VAVLPNFEDFRQAAITEAIGLPTRLTREILEADGSEAGIAVSMAAAVGEEAAVFDQQQLAETRLNTAATQGRDALEQWALANYGVTSQGPLSAIATLLWTRDPSATPTTILARTSVTADGIVFETDEDLVIPVSATSGSVTATSQSTGVSTNVDKDTITSAQVLPDPTLVVTNPEPAAGGSDGESVDEFAARLQTFFAAAVKGTKTAVETCARDTPGVADATAFELLDSDGGAEGRGQVIISGSNSQANSALAQSVVFELEECRGLGVPIYVFAGQPLFVNIVVEGILFVAGVNTAEVLGTARRSIKAKVNLLAPGIALRQGLIIGVLEGIEGLILPAGAVKEPAGDLAPSSTAETIRTDIPLILLNGS
jgi:hypothetical protein